MTATEQRFQAARDHPGTPALLAYVPEGEEESGLGGILSSAAAVALFVLLGLLFAMGLAATFPPLALVPIALVAVGLVFYGITVHKEWRRRTAPLERRLALVIGEETQMRGAGAGAARTLYVFTLEYDDGSRVVVHSAEESAGRVRTGDIGVAYLRADVLIQLERIPV